jgi:hypothetical protein
MQPEEFADLVVTAIKLANAPLVARIAALESTPAGRDGRDGQPGPPGPFGRDGVDGRDGKDGADGLGFDDFEETYDGERTFTRRYIRNGTVLREFVWSVPYVLDRGVYQAGKTYVQGDTCGGSFWIAQQTTDARPETSPAWRLAVKRGAAGRDGAR